MKKNLAKKKKASIKARESDSVSYWGIQWRGLKRSFKDFFRRGYLRCFILDLLFLISLLVIMKSSLVMVDSISLSAVPKLNEILMYQQSGDNGLVENALIEYEPILKKVLYLSFLIGVVAFLLFLLAISLLYGQNWLRLRGRALSMRFVRKYFVYNLLWFTFWIIILLLTVNMLTPDAALIILPLMLLVLFYSDQAYRSVFDEEKTIWTNLKLTLKLVKKIHFFIFFTIAALLLLILMLFLLGLMVTNMTLFSISALLMFTLFIGWSRHYAFAIVSNMVRGGKM